MRHTPTGGPPICWFQSAPGREAGRCVIKRIHVEHATVFQSAPGREAGRCLLRVAYQESAFRPVSIRARP